MRGRTGGFKLTDEHRGKIANSSILNCLIEHAEGRREMSSTQVSAALGLLKKVLPDLQATENKTEVTMANVVALPERAASTEEWQSKVTTHH